MIVVGPVAAANVDAIHTDCGENVVTDADIADRIVSGSWLCAVWHSENVGHGEGAYHVSVDSTNSQGVVDSSVFWVYETCYKGICCCEHRILGESVELRPCRMFSECYLWDSVDENAEYLLKGACFGYHVVNENCPCRYKEQNYNSILSTRNHEIMSTLVKKELSVGKVTLVDELPRCVHSLGAVEKVSPDDSYGIRPITDCSRSDNIDCVNSYVDEICETFKYKGLDDVSDIVTNSAYMSVCDISDAYRSVNIYAADREYQGLEWDFRDGQGPSYMMDNRLCFGLSSGPAVFNALSELVVRCMDRRGHMDTINYLDDFLVVRPTMESCMEAQRTLIHVLRVIGFSISYKKLLGPAQVVRYLGIDVDSVNMNLSLPVDKLIRLKTVVDSFLNRKKATKKELEELTGLLNHCAQVVRGARTFMRRLYDACNSVSKQHYKVRLSQEFKADLIWWQEFAAVFNGKARIMAHPSLAIASYSDSSFYGFAAYHNTDWLAGCWDKKEGAKLKLVFGHHWCEGPESWNENINELEFWPVLCAANRWGHLWDDYKVILHTDNTQVLHTLNSGRSANRVCMGWVRKVFWVAVKQNFYYSSVYIPSRYNVICDALSRWCEVDARSRLLDATSPDSLCCYNDL